MQPRLRAAPARPSIPLGSEPDARLVELMRGGDEGAFDEIVTRYRGPLIAYCRPLLGPERAEDAVQETFMNAYRALGEGDSEMQLRPWLYRIAHNASIDALRRRVDFEQLDENHDGVERPDQALERREHFNLVLNAVQALPARQRDAIVLRELEGRSYDEIAAALEVKSGAVRQLIHRARERVRSAAAALLPPWLLARLPSAGRPASAEAVELVAGAGATATAAKVAATVVVSGAVAAAGGLGLNAGGDGSGATEARASDPPGGGPVQVIAALGGGDLARDALERGRARGRRLSGGDSGDGEGRGGRGSGERDGDRDGDSSLRSGSGSGSDDDRDGSVGADGDRSGSNSGLGSGGDDFLEDRSGPSGGELSDSAGSGSGSGSELESRSGSNSGSG